MARLIDADILLQNFDDMEPYEEYESEHDLWLDMRMEVIHAPTITPPEIVCCQDCVHHEDGYAHWCNKWEHICPDDSEFFCKYGRKKDGKDRSI